MLAPALSGFPHEATAHGDGRRPARPLSRPAEVKSHRGCLAGPSGSDFDIYLQKWNGSSWRNVAQGVGSTSTEHVSYNGTAGYYVWRIVSYSGSGSYTLKMQRP